MKTIDTHINPDLDAVCGVWLIKRFLPGWKEAKIEFMPAGKVDDVDKDPQILYVDTGRGKLDHHHTGKYLSASGLCLEYILKNRQGQPLSSLDKQAIKRLVAVVTEIDNARDLNWEEVKKDRARFYLHCLVDGLRGLAYSDREVIEFGFKMLDAVLLNFKNKIRAEEELKKGIEFETPWGKGVAVKTGNKQVLWEGELMGYVLVIKKDPGTGGVEIYSRYDTKVDLTKAYKKAKEQDPNSDWFLHASKKLLLNQASVNPNMRPTKLSLRQIIEIVKNG